MAVLLPGWPVRVVDSGAAGERQPPSGQAGGRRTHPLSIPAAVGNQRHRVVPTRRSTVTTGMLQRRRNPTRAPGIDVVGGDDDAVPGGAGAASSIALAWMARSCLTVAYQ